MKLNRTLSSGILSLAIVGLLAPIHAGAATKLMRVVKFNATTTDSVLNTRPKSWRDPAFGDMGWTHHSDWGTVTAKAGQTITITAISTQAGVHPGISVWSRGADDTAPNAYVVDHFYPQNANTVEFGAVDETTGQALGNIIMKIAAFGYDKDGNKMGITTMNPIKDGVPGKLVISFKAPRNAAYMFVLGGFNPDAAVDATVKYDIDTNVIVTGP